MATYRYLVADLTPNSDGIRPIRGTVPLSEVRWGPVWNRPGALEARIDLRHPNATRDLIDPGRTGIYVERNGQIVWGGILWYARPDDTWTATIRALGYLSALQGPSGETGRHINHPLAFDSVGQLDIARQLVTYAQDETLHGAGADLGIVVPAGPAGKIRDRRWWPWQRKNIGDALVELGNIIEGITFTFTHHAETSEHGRQIVTTFRATEGNPRRLPHTFKLGRNIRRAAGPIDATRMARRVHMLGEGTEADQVQATVTASSPGYPLMEAVNAAHLSVVDRSTLEAHGRDWLNDHTLPMVLPALVVDPENPTVGAYQAGDEVQVRCQLQHATATTIHGPEPLMDGDTELMDGGIPLVTDTLHQTVLNNGAPPRGLFDVDGWYRLAGFTVEVGDTEISRPSEGRAADEEVTLELMESR